jgi:hypothetical protein
MAAGNTYTQIASTTLGSAASSVTFSSIASTYTDLVIVVQAAVTTGSVALRMQFNSDTGANYSSTWISGTGSSAISGRTSGTTYMKIDEYSGMNTTLGGGLNLINVMNYSNATTFKTALTRPNRADLGVDAVVGLWRSTAAINSITLLTSSSTFVTGSTFNLYGISAA